MELKSRWHKLYIDFTWVVSGIQLQIFSEAQVSFQLKLSLITVQLALSWPGFFPPEHIYCIMATRPRRCPRAWQVVSAGRITHGMYRRSHAGWCPHAGHDAHGRRREHSSANPFSSMFIYSLFVQAEDEYDKNTVAQIFMFLFVLDFTSSFELGRSESG